MRSIFSQAGEFSPPLELAKEITGLVDTTLFSTELRCDTCSAYSLISRPTISHTVAGASVGIRHSTCLLRPTYLFHGGTLLVME